MFYSLNWVLFDAFKDSPGDILVIVNNYLNMQCRTSVPLFWQWEQLHRPCWHVYDAIGADILLVAVACSLYWRLLCRYGCFPHSTLENQSLLPVSQRSKATTNTALKTMVYHKIKRGLSGIDWLNQLWLISFGKGLKVISVKNLKLIQKYYRCGQSLTQLSLPSIGWPQTNTHQWATQLCRWTCFIINMNMVTVVYFGSVANWGWK